MADQCPVCDGFMSSWEQVEQGIIAVEGVKCPHCGYTREMAFGAHRIIVNGKAFEWDSTMSDKRIRTTKKLCAQELENARAALYSV